MPWRSIALAVVMLASLVAGFWFGGSLERAPSVAAVVAVAACVLLGDVLGPTKSWQARVMTAALAGVVFAAGWHLGGREIDAAFSECASRGEEVRRALEIHRRQYGGYPDSLMGLVGFEIPGQRILRPGLMQYTRTDDGYLLWYQDSQVRASATTDRGFFDSR